MIMYNHHVFLQLLLFCFLFGLMDSTTQKKEDITLIPSSVSESSISRNLEEKKTQQPTRQPTNKFVAPSVPEDLVTKSPVPTTVPTKGGTATTPIKAVTSTTTTKPSGMTKDSSSPTLKPTMSMVNSKITVPTHIPGTATADDKTIGGAVNVNAEIKSETKTALNSARYFMYTFLGALGCFALVFFLKRGVPSNEVINYELLAHRESNDSI